jgi:hypothetical protein
LSDPKFQWHYVSTDKLEPDDWFNKCSLGHLGPTNVQSVALYATAVRSSVKGGYSKFLADALFAAPRLKVCQASGTSREWIEPFIDPFGLSGSGGTCREPSYTDLIFNASTTPPTTPQGPPATN